MFCVPSLNHARPGHAIARFFYDAPAEPVHRPIGEAAASVDRFADNATVEWNERKA